jgi:uncharacterized protein (TIRG00374 family)
VSEPGTVSVQLLSQGLVRRLSVAIVLGAVAYGALLLWADGRAMAGGFAQLTLEALARATALTCASFLVRLVRWQGYLRRLRLEVPLVESVLVFFSGLAMSITPGKVGEVLKSLMLRESSDVAIARSAPIVVAERICDLIGLLLLGGFGLLSLSGYAWTAAIVLVVPLALASVVGSRRLGLWLIHLLTGFRRTRRFRDKLVEAFESLRELVTPVTLLWGTVLSVVSWGMQGLALAAIANDFAGVSLSVPAAMIAYAAPLLAGTLAMIPGGLGLTEASMTGVIVKFGGAGATVAIGASIAVTIRLITFWFAIALGFCALGIWRVRRRSHAVV